MRRPSLRHGASLRPRAPSARRLAALLTAWAAAACGPGPSEGAAPATVAVATRSCGPTDGAAVEISLAPALDSAGVPRAPYVSVVIWQPPDQLAGRTWALTGRAPVGSAARYSAATEFEVATRGTATVLAVGADTTIVGAVDLTFPGGTRVRQAFRAAWRSSERGRPLCG